MGARSVLAQTTREWVLAHFVNQPPRDSHRGATFLEFPMACADVGTTELRDWDSEILIWIGDTWHFHAERHSTCWPASDEDIAAHGEAACVAQQVVRFLDLLFSDAVLLWRAEDEVGLSFDDDDDSHPDRPPRRVLVPAGARCYVWSGPAPLNRWTSADAV